MKHKINEMLKKISERKAIYYRLLDNKENDSYHYDIMEERGAEIIYGSLPSEEEEGLNFYAMGVIPIGNTLHFTTSWEIHPHEGVGREITIKGSNEEGDQVAIFIFPQGSPIGALFGGVEIPIEEFEKIWKELRR